MTAQAFGRIEQCACCGKDVKRPVKYRGVLVGKDCASYAKHVRLIQMLRGREAAILQAHKDYPRATERVIKLAGI